MSKITNIERVDSILEDVDGLSSHNVQSMRELLTNDITWLCNYVMKVEKFLQLIDLDYNKTETTTYMGGYFSALKDLKNEVDDV